MANNIEKGDFEEVSATPPISEEGKIATKIEDNPHLKEFLRGSPERFEDAKEGMRKELREEGKKAREKAILKKLEEMIKEDPSLKEAWDENPEELKKVMEEISGQLWEEAESNNKE